MALAITFIITNFPRRALNQKISNAPAKHRAKRYQDSEFHAHLFSTKHEFKDIIISSLCFTGAPLPQ